MHITNRQLVIGAAVLAVVVTSTAAAPLPPQNPQQAQMNADLRQLTEITQQLRQAVNQLSDAVKDLKEQIKTVNGRLDTQQTQVANGFATQKSITDGMTTTLATLEQKLRDNNVNVQSLSQEMTAIRQGLTVLTDLITQLSQGQAPAGSDVKPITMPDSPEQMMQEGFGYYSQAKYDLAIKTYTDFLTQYPNSPRAPEAQHQIALSFSYWGKTQDAIDAFTVVVTKYKDCGCKDVPESYFQRGNEYQKLKQIQKAIDDYKFIQTEYNRTKSPVWADMKLMADNTLKNIIK